MQYLKNEGDYVIFKSTYLNVISVNEFNINIQNITEDENKLLIKEFRWSVDDESYSAWSESNLNNISNINFEKYGSKIYFEFRITYIGKNEIPFKDIEIILNVNRSKNTTETYPPGIKQHECGNLTSISRLEDLCFKPYDVNPAVCLYDELNYLVNNMFGHEVNYYRKTPNKNAEDVYLMEYPLYNREEGRCVKIMVDNNEFPSDKLEYNPFGIDFEHPFEVQIEKKTWEDVFNDGTAPQKGDIIHIPIMGKIYEVLSSHFERGFMMNKTHWSLTLVKWNPSSNTYSTSDITSTLDEITTSISKEFEEEMRQIEEVVVKPQQFSDYEGDKVYDPIRKEVHENICIVENNLYNYTTLISKTQYDLSNLVNCECGQDTTAVIYKQVPEYCDDIELTYQAWISRKENKKIKSSKIENSGLNVSTGEMLIELEQTLDLVEGDYVKIYRGLVSYYGIVIEKQDEYRYNVEIPQAVLEHLNNTASNWDMFTNYNIEKTHVMNLINGHDNNKGFRLDIIGDKFVRFINNENEYILGLNHELIIGEWYAININISEVYEQFNVNIWKRKDDKERTTDLFNIFTKTINNIKINPFDINKNYSLHASDYLITNIRLFDKIITFEKQPFILNQNIVQDSDRAIIIDNAVQILNIPFIGESK